MGTYRNLLAWQRAMDLVDAVYDLVAGFPRQEIYGLGQQLKSAAISVPSNIAESRGRFTPAEERQFVRHARGSNYEVQTQLEIAQRRMFGSNENITTAIRLAEEVGRLINGLLNSTKV